MITNNNEANPITITAIAHWGSNTSSSAKPTVGTTCFGRTVNRNVQYIWFKMLNRLGKFDLKDIKLVN